jgi:hypothetical protein
VHIIGEQKDQEKDKTCRQKCAEISTATKICAILFILVLIFVILGIVFNQSSSDSDSHPVLTTFTAATSSSTTVLTAASTKWVQLFGNNGTGCARKDPFSFFYRGNGATPSGKLFVQFEGGNPCFDTSSCDSTIFNSNYNQTTGVCPLKHYPKSLCRC